MDSFLGSIKLFAGNFAPVGWAVCDGSLLAIAENEALFALLGTTYGGDGQTTFALPDLRGRVPVSQGSNYPLGMQSGVAEVAMGAGALPAHSHGMLVSTGPANNEDPGGGVLAASSVDVYSTTLTSAALNAASIGLTGSGRAHNNMQPYLGLTYLIAVQGIFPSA